MNKIKLYSLGAACWFSSLVCYAAEKFEVLPDLPDPLAYAVQPAEASTVSGSPEAPLAAAQSIGHEPSLLSVVLSLVFVILLIYVTGIIYAKLNRLGFKTLKQTGDFGSFGEFHHSCIQLRCIGRDSILLEVTVHPTQKLSGKVQENTTIELTVTRLFVENNMMVTRNKHTLSLPDMYSFPFVLQDHLTGIDIVHRIFA